MNCDEAQELITARVDNELSETERRAIDGHLALCRLCQQAFDQERQIKQQLRLTSAAIVAPEVLREKVGGALDKSTVWDLFNDRIRALVTTRWVRPGLAVALVLLVISAVMFRVTGDSGIATATLKAHAAIESGEKAFARADDPAELKRKLVQAVGGRFAPMGFDLSMMKLYPIAGFMQILDSRQVLVTVYRGGGPDVTCFTFLGSESDAPAEAKRVFDEVKKINFYIFGQGDYHAVMHREGEVICIMVSKMPAVQLLALAREKARHA